MKYDPNESPSYWKQNGVTKMWEPSDYPSPYEDKDYSLPDGISESFNHLRNVIEYKYRKQHIKMCAFYNKMFPTLKSIDWERSSANAPPFSSQEQERADGSTGISENFLKAIIDKVVARVSNVHFDVKLNSDTPDTLFEIYKEPVERHLKRLVRDNRLQRLVTEVFHDAAILGYGHFFMDPFSGAIRKVSDWELGYYESEFNYGPLKRAMIRDYAFPVTALQPYLRQSSMDADKVKEVIENKPHVDLILFIDCMQHKACATINNETLEPIEYPFDEVLLATYSWDLGIKRVLTGSLFDLLYPLQRSISKLNAKKTQLIENYKGPVPVFNNDCDVVVKTLGNGTGEALFLASGRNPADVLTVINPMPLDPEMNAEKEQQKQTMEELGGVQEISLDMENIRSAATVIALNQLHDQVFQSQLAGIGVLVSDTLENSLRYAAAMGDSIETIENIPWADIIELLDVCKVEVSVTHNNDPNNKKEEPETDYGVVCVDRAILRILRGESEWADVSQDYTVDPNLIKPAMAMKALQMKASTGEVPELLEKALIDAFIDDISFGAAVI